MTKASSTDIRPYVGVLLTNGLINKLKKTSVNFPSYSRVLELAKEARAANVHLFFFASRNVDFKKKYINGIYLDFKKQRWLKKRFPFPHVLYDRLGSRNEKVLKLRKTMETEGVKKLNSMFYFNKWAVYEDLSRIENVKQFLPETKLFTDEDSLEEFIDENKVVYLKGVKSGKGKGVMQIKKVDNKYIYSHFKGMLTVNEADSFAAMMDDIHSFYNQKADSRFILQKGIDLINYGGNNVDFRAEVQRDGEGNLDIVGISARIAIKNSPITIHSSAVKLDTFLTDYLHYPKEEMELKRVEIINFLHLIYHALEKVYGYFGEIGIDFGLDKEGKIWFIEPNAKTAKVSLMKAHDHQTYKKAFYNPISFSMFLANQPDDWFKKHCGNFSAVEEEIAFSCDEEDI